ncbi:MAG: 5'-methylthioadenosine/adenosylhomocysteine nucleosidase [Muribaculaceae bacterium]|nr:5'-methylthioadenosine/adenosylhomocysteine nucleosidase [Muribaculaceae bacterium]
MKIGIIVAMDKELALLLPLMASPRTERHGRFEFHTGTIAGHSIVAAKVGIGKVNAALGTQAMIDFYSPDMVINTGVAGGTGLTDKPVQVLDVVLPDRVAYHDVWCGPGTEPGQAAGCPMYFTSPLSDETAAAVGARRGLLASGDIFVDKVSDIERIAAVHPDAVAVDMESAAIAQTCYLADVPFVCIRVISDTPGSEGNAAAYETFWQDAPERTFQAVEHLLELL